MVYSLQSAGDGGGRGQCRALLCRGRCKVGQSNLPKANQQTPTAPTKPKPKETGSEAQAVHNNDDAVQPGQPTAEGLEEAGTAQGSPVQGQMQGNLG